MRYVFIHLYCFIFVHVTCRLTKKLTKHFKIVNTNLYHCTQVLYNYSTSTTVWGRNVGTQQERGDKIDSLRK